MSLFTDASLVLIPSAVKISKAYSIKPTDGTGDLTFTRSNDTATRVGSDGLIEKVRTNVLLQSNDFSTSWSKTKVTVTANATTDPDGLTNANKVEVNTTGNNELYQYVTGMGVGYSLSVYVKKDTAQWVALGTNGISSQTVWFDLNSGLVGYEATGYTGNIESVGSGWYRCSVFVGSGALSSPYFDFLITNVDGVLGATVGKSVFVWNGQVETGDIATDYIATTTAAVSVGMLANTPRLDYSGGATCPKLLLEGQRTNLALFSEQFDNAAWFQGRLATTANTQASPSGTISADTITDTVISGTHRLYTTGDISVVSGTSYASSCFVKAGTSNRVELRIMSNTESDIGILGAVFNLSNGTIVSGSGSIEDYGNGWYRCTNTGTSNTTGNAKQFIYLYNSINQKTYLGTGTNTLFIWGAQIEAGAYATSYIPTLGAAVTRGADSCSKTGISSLIGQTEGTLFFDFEFPSTNQNSARIYTVSDGANLNVIRTEIYESSPTTFQFRTGIATAGVDQGDSFTTITQLRNKIAISYGLNDVKIYINGSLVATDTTVTIPATSALFLANRNNAGNFAAVSFSQALLFPTRLTNVQLAELTSL